MLSQFIIRRPVFASVVSLLIVIIGGVAVFGLPVEQYPELAPPIVRVEALYPGANAQVIADTVASPLELEINGVENMIYMQSTSADGRYSLDISFEPGTDVDIAAVLVQNRVSIAETRLPEEVRRLGITTRKQSTNFVGVVALWSPLGPDGKSKYDDVALSNFMSLSVRDEISRVPGVGAANVLPAKEYGMRVWLDPNLLKARALTVADVVGAIRAQNVQVAAGALGREPAPPGTDRQLILDTLGRLQTPEQFGNIIVKVDANGAFVRVSDVGRVELGTRDYSTLSTFNGQPSAVMPIYQLPGANLTNTSHLVNEKFNELAREFPEGIQGKMFYDAAMFIEASLAEVEHTLIEAFILVAVVVLVFLQSWRTTLIPLITIPVSLIGAFIVMQMLGFSINMLTMFGLVLAIGIVVDDAIVVVENVERNLALGGDLDVVEVTIKSMNEITSPVISITLVLMSVFIPAAFLPGITGTMFRQFALTIAAATFFSAVNALTLSPALCALLLRRHDHHAKQSRFARLVGAPGRAFNWTFDRLAAGYAWLITVVGRFLTPVALLVFAGVLGVTFYMLARTPRGFVPNEDLGFVVAAMQLPDNATLQRSKAVIDRVSDQARSIKGVQDVVTLSGFSVLDGQASNVANAWIVLEPWKKRTPDGRGVEVIMDELRGKLAGIQEANGLVFSLPAISGLGNTSGFDLRLLDRQVVGRQALGSAVESVVSTAFGQPEIAVAFSSFRPGVEQLFLNIDREKAMKFGIPIETVFATLQTFLGSAYVNDFNYLNRTFQVNVQAESQYRLEAEDIRRLQVRNREGDMVPLSALVQIENSFGPERITRYNQYPSATVNGIPKPGFSSGQTLDVMDRILQSELPPGIGYAWTSMSYQEKQVGNSTVLAFAFAIVLVYLILAAQYESWFTPLAVVLSLPLVIIGAMIALAIAGLDNNLFTQIGLVLLVGLGAKNAILIVEFAKENRASGKGIVESAALAARDRFRPILMTSLAFILGVLPLVLATGAGAAGRQSLGTAVFGGMISATILVLLFTPILYVAVQWTTERTHRLIRGRPTSNREPATPGNGDHHDGTTPVNGHTTAQQATPAPRPQAVTGA